MFRGADLCPSHVCGNEEIAHGATGAAVGNVRQNLVKSFDFIATSLILHNAPILSQDSVLETVHDFQHNEGRATGGRWQLFEIAEEKDMNVAEAVVADGCSSTCVVCIAQSHNDTLENIFVHHAHLSAPNATDRHENSPPNKSRPATRVCACTTAFPCMSVRLRSRA